MPRRQFDKNTSTTFHLVHRPQDDPKIHDDQAGSMVFQEVAPTQAHKIKRRQDLEGELFGGSESGEANVQIRENEGEAAEHGIYYDDTEYDYMQHIRDLNESGEDGESSVFVEAKAASKKGNGKISLEEALRNSHISAMNEHQELPIHERLLTSTHASSAMNFSKSTYQSQQDVPDEIAGLQPDMDPRLREVLEALDDDAYVDDEEDLFGKIVEDGQEIPPDEFSSKPSIEQAVGQYDDDDEGWESDVTEKAATPGNHSTHHDLVQPLQELNMQNDEAASGPTDHDDGAWMKEFSKFKADHKRLPAADPVPKSSDVRSSVMTGSSSLLGGGRRKKRKGAMTSTSGYSMTSSTLARTEGQTLLDARFDKIEEEYADDGVHNDDDDDDDGTASVMTGGTSFTRASKMSCKSTRSGISTSSSQVVPDLTMAGLDGIMDDFLGNYSMSGKRRIKKGGYQTGLEQLDEVRKQLGPARIAPRTGKA